jgi:hypothetical protein
MNEPFPIGCCGEVVYVKYLVIFSIFERFVELLRHIL